MEIKQQIYAAWNSGARNILAVLPTGAGKTVTFSDIIHEHKGVCCAIAHRQELVCQISLALAQDEIRHRIIGPASVVRLCVNIHMQEIGTSYYDPSASCAVAGIDTLTRRSNDPWFQTVTLWVQDEAHHVLTKNKWGKAITMFPNARGLGVTATPLRADGKGLGRHADGVFDTMVLGLGMRDLINQKYLTDYRIFAPLSDIDFNDVTISKTTGEFNPDKLRKAVHKSHVIGDVVSHYMKIAPGRLGVTFAVDVQTATDIAEQFNRSGVPAEVVHAKTPDAQRIAIIKRFRNRQLMQLVNVDLFGEGFDLPAIEVISMARPTQSYPLYVQQFGRSLRPMEGKTVATIIDHVGNVIRHGLPDAPRLWSLDRRESRDTGGSDAIPVRACPACTSVYERFLKTCPFCDHTVTPAERSGPEFVDGDLLELSPEALARMRGEVDKIDMDLGDYGDWLASRNVSGVVHATNVKRHRVRQETQAVLRESIAYWAGGQRAKGRSDSESYRRFYFMFGCDVLTAVALGTTEARELTSRVNNRMEAV